MRKTLAYSSIKFYKVPHNWSHFVWHCANIGCKIDSVIASESYRTEYKYNYCNYHYLYLSLYIQLLEDAVSQDLEEVSEKNQLMVVDSLVSAMQGWSCASQLHHQLALNDNYLLGEIPPSETWSLLNKNPCSFDHLQTNLKV